MFFFSVQANGYTTQLSSSSSSGCSITVAIYLKGTRKATRLRSLATRPVGAERSLVHVDLATRKADGPYKKKLRIYLRIVARDKKQVPAAQKDLIYEDIQDEFHILEAFDVRTKKKKIVQTVGERWR
ncbi:hypothetical protein HKD37_02G004764 [Glycine soja]